MTPSVLLAAATLVAFVAQGDERVDRIVAMSLADDAALTAEVQQFPDAAREAFAELLRLSTGDEEALDAADVLAESYFEAWTDPFYLQEAGRFRSWSRDARRSKLEADSLRLAGNEAFSEVGVEAAFERWRHSLELSRSVPDTAGIGRTLGNFGAGFYAVGNADSAEAYLSDAYEYALAVGDVRTVAGALTNLASISYEYGDLSRAAELYATSLDHLARTGDARFQSANQHNLALVSMALGDLQTARTSLDESIRLSRLHGYPEDEAEGLSSLADVALAEGAYDEADAALTTSLELSRSTSNRVAEAGALHSRGLLKAGRGDYRAAETDLVRALEIYEELGLASDAAEVRIDLASLLAAMGAVGAGLEQLRITESLVESASLGPILAADAALVAADLRALLNDYEGAAADYDRAGGLYRASNDLRGQADADRGRGLMELTRDNWTIAADRLSRARNESSAAGHVRSRAITGLYLAYALDRAGEVDAARATLEEALGDLEQLDDPVTTAALIGMQADVEARAARLATADSLYVRALAVLGEREVPEVAWRLHAGRAEVLTARGRPAAAEQELELAVAAIETGAAGAAFHRRGSFLLDKWQVYARLAVMQADRDDAAEAFQTSERLRAGRTLATLSGGRTDQPAGDPAELRAREQDLRRRMAALSARLYGTADLPPSLREPTVALSAGDLESALLRIQEEYGQVLDLIRQTDTGYADLVTPEIPDLEQVANRLAADEIFVEYLVGETSTVAVVISSDASDVLTLDIGREQLADLVFFARGAIERERTGSDADLWAAPLRRLYAELIGPIENDGWLDGKTRLVIAPHAELHYLPFQALITDRNRVEFLVQELAIAYAPSASVWLRLSDRSRSGNGTELLALAPRSDDLPGSDYEVRAITNLLDDDPTVLVGRDATEQAFRDAAGDSDVLHLATYGSMNRQNPLFSWLDLAPDDTGDARLEVHEVYGLELDARLVVLSACETGLGAGSQTNAPAGDDWVSLTRAFLSAGSDNVVASLWRVEDLATATLMEKFYRELGDGVGLADALAIAQRSLIDDPDTAHPFYWAGFSLVGEARGSL